MSDWSIIKQWWSSLTDRGGNAFLAVTPPTRERYTQDEGHQDAAEQLAAEGLEPGTPYVVWHWQAHRFDRSGRLTGSNPIYFGGDRDIVAAKLSTVPDGFHIDGGRNDQEAFLLAKVRDLGGIDPGNEPQAAAVLAELTTWRPGPITAQEIAWCRRVVTDPQATAQTRQQAFAVLYEEHALTDEILDIALHDATVLWGDPPSSGVNMLAAALLQAGRPDASIFVDELLSATPDLVAPGILELRGGPAALQVAARRAEQGVDVDTYLRLAVREQNRDFRDVAIELTAQNASKDHVRRALARALPRAVAWPQASPLMPDIRLETQAVLDLLEAESLPAQLRADIADALDYLPGQLSAMPDAPSGEDSTADRQWLTEQLGRWERAVAQLHADGDAIRWQGIDLTSASIRQQQQESGSAPTPPQIAWYREKLHDEGLAEPALGFCLSKVFDAGAITDDDLDRLLRGWKKRFAKAPDTYDKHRPGLVTLGIALAETGHPGASKFFDGVQALKPKWAAACRNVLLGWYGTSDDLPALWTQALEAKDHAAVGWSILRSRIDGTSIALACDAGIRIADDADARPYTSRHLAIAAIAWGDHQRRLWHYSFDENSRPWFDRAIELAEDSTLSSRIRQIAYELASGHRLIEYPEHLAPPAGAAEAEDARNRLAAAADAIRS